MIKRICLMCLIAVYYVFIFCLKLNTHGISYCYNDVYCYAQYYGVALILFVAGFYIINMMKYEYRDAVVILENNMKKMWIRISCKLACESVFISIYSFIVCTVYAAVKGYSYGCNWTDEYSGAWLVMLKCTEINIDTILVQLLYLVIVFSEIYVSGMLIMLMWWWFRVPIYGYCITLVAVALELFGYLDNGIYFAKMSLNPSHMYLYGYSIVNNIIVPICAIVIMWIIGFFAFRKKDMMRKESDI